MNRTIKFEWYFTGYRYYRVRSQEPRGQACWCFIMGLRETSSIIDHLGWDDFRVK